MSVSVEYARKQTVDLSLPLAHEIFVCESGILGSAKFGKTKLHHVVYPHFKDQGQYDLLVASVGKHFKKEGFKVGRAAITNKTGVKMQCVVISWDWGF